MFRILRRLRALRVARGGSCKLTSFTVDRPNEQLCCLEVTNHYLKALPNKVPRGMRNYFFSNLSQWKFHAGSRGEEVICLKALPRGRGRNLPSSEGWSRGALDSRSVLILIYRA